MSEASQSIVTHGNYCTPTNDDRAFAWDANEDKAEVWAWCNEKGKSLSKMRSS